MLWRRTPKLSWVEFRPKFIGKAKSADMVSIKYDPQTLRAIAVPWVRASSRLLRVEASTPGHKRYSLCIGGSDFAGAYGHVFTDHIHPFQSDIGFWPSIGAQPVNPHNAGHPAPIWALQWLRTAMHVPLGPLDTKSSQPDLRLKVLAWPGACWLILPKKVPKWVGQKTDFSGSPPVALKLSLPV